MNHAFYALRHLHERAKLGEAHDRPLDRRPNRKLLRSINPRIAQRLLQPQRDPLFAGIDSEDHGLDCFAGLHQIARLAFFLDPRHLRNVNQSFDSWLQLHKCSEIGDASHCAAHAIADLVLAGYRFPRMRLELLHSDRNASLLGINFENPGLDLLADREHVRRFVGMTPGNVTDMQQRVHPAYIDEGPAISETSHCAADRLSLL